MKSCFLIPALAVMVAVGCDSPLKVTPKGTVPTDVAISDAASARAALAGAYHGLQSTSSYGEEMVEVGDLSSDNAENTGSFTSYLELDDNTLRSNNATVLDLWSGSYDNINRSNEILDKVPLITGMDPDEQNEILGEAYFLRALNYHNLVKYFGDVPLRLHAATSINDLGTVTRAPVATVYDQILRDLDSAGVDITIDDQTTQASVGAVQALRARVLFYQGNYAGADSAALAVEGMDYDLAPNYGDLFSPTGNSTPEDIFRITFTQLQESFMSFDYLTEEELEPTLKLVKLYDPNADTTDLDTYDPVDTRGQFNILIDDGVFGNKYRSITGTEFFPVIRFAEVILIRAESEARLGHLVTAVEELQRVQTRANVPLFILGAHTQQQVIDAIVLERQKELALEGDRWNDLNRLGITASVLGIPQTQTLFPIPQREIDVTPGLTQNPGY